MRPQAIDKQGKISDAHATIEAVSLFIETAPQEGVGITNNNLVVGVNLNAVATHVVGDRRLWRGAHSCTVEHHVLIQHT